MRFFHLCTLCVIIFSSIFACKSTSNASSKAKGIEEISSAELVEMKTGSFIIEDKNRNLSANISYLLKIFKRKSESGVETFEGLWSSNILNSNWGDALKPDKDHKLVVISKLPEWVDLWPKDLLELEGLQFVSENSDFGADGPINNIFISLASLERTSDIENIFYYNFRAELVSKFDQVVKDLNVELAEFGSELIDKRKVGKLIGSVGMSYVRDVEAEYFLRIYKKPDSEEYSGILHIETTNMLFPLTDRPFVSRGVLSGRFEEECQCITLKGPRGLEVKFEKSTMGAGDAGLDKIIFIEDPPMFTFYPDQGPEIN
ncbi:MAG: hypothetical protein KBD78_01560 [Oligoflexales bacterium]|nr:hypothetical protein [Oligoflexales bacterium]